MPELILQVPAPLAGHVDGRPELRIEAATLADAYRRLFETTPLLAGRLFADDGTPRPYVHLYLDGRDVRSVDPALERIEPGSVLTIVASIAGGRPGRPAELTAEDRFRYHRQIILPGFGESGQARLRESSVLLVGAGGLGSPAALYLAAAGVGRIGIVDADAVDLSNLHRQVLHHSGSVGAPKVQSARDAIARLNPGIEVVPIEQRLRADNALDLMSGWDVVVDGSDNFPTRYLVNDACVLLGIPFAYGAVFRWEGQASVFAAPGGPCYRCLFRDPPPADLVPGCEEAGVLGVLPGMIGTIQAAETLKLLLGAGQALVGRLLLVDAATMEFRQLEVRRDPECPLCGDDPSITGLVDYEAFCGLSGGEADARQAARPDIGPTSEQPVDLMEIAGAGPGGVPEIDVGQLEQIIRSGRPVQLVDVREAHEWEISNLGFAGATLIPLGQLFDRLDELDLDSDMVVYCRTGSRSGMAVRYLQAHGVERAVNLRGGINDWSLRIDPSMPRY